MSNIDDLPEGAIDIGHDVYIVKLHDKEGKWVAIDEYHRNPTTGAWCGGFAPFDVESGYLTRQSEKWTVNSFEPLDLSPSLLCRACNHHGYIKQGRWEPCG